MTMDDLAGKYQSASSASSASSHSASSEDAHAMAGTRRGANKDEEDDEIRVISIANSREPGSKEDDKESVGEQERPVDEQANPLAEAGSTASIQIALKRWVSEALALRDRHGIRFNNTLRQNVKFHNPAVCAKMIAFCGLDEHGTNASQGSARERPALDPNAYYDVLAERQVKIMEERASRNQETQNRTHGQAE
jgi:hypothetical protein